MFGKEEYKVPCCGEDCTEIVSENTKYKSQDKWRKDSAMCKACWDKEQIELAEEKAEEERKSKMTKEELREEKKQDMKNEIEENLSEVEVVFEVVLEVLEEKEELLDKFGDFVLKRFRSAYKEGIDLHVDCLIEAVEKMEEAGFERDDAITLLTSGVGNRRVA